MSLGVQKYLRNQSLARQTIGPFFSAMLHFAFTGRRASGSGGKALTALSKVKAPLMAELLEGILKACLPSFSSVASNESIVEKLHLFLEKSSSGPATSNPTGHGAAATAGSDSDSEEAKFKALVFFANEGLGLEKMVEGAANAEFGSKLSKHMQNLSKRTLGFI